MLKRSAIGKVPVASKRPRSAEMNSKSENLQVKVFVRVRPFNERELQCSCRKVVSIGDETCIIFDPEEEEEPFFFKGMAQKGRDITRRMNKNMLFEFDHVFDENATNLDVFQLSTKGLISSIFEGYNCSVFAYGATGAGKTFTMLGTEEQPGIAFLTIVELLEYIEKSTDVKVSLGVSYLEVYNENVKDLLFPSNAVLHLREDYGRTTVSGLTLKEINHSDEIFTLLTEGNRNRTQHPTDSNSESSRSHAVFQVHARIESKTEVKISKLSMIDLAGSERAAATGCKGIRFKEGANINKSLLALGNCINALADGLKHVPYRDSKLTRLLKDSLGGNCRTIMIANVSPSSSSFEDTYNTLKYATRTKCIKSVITKNILNGSMSISDYKKTINELKEKLSMMEEKHLVELDHWKERIETIFKERKNIYREILSLQSQAKLTDWRIQLKEQAIALHDRTSKVPCSDRLGNGINQLKARSDSIRGRLDDYWPAQEENKQQIAKLEEEISAQTKLGSVLKAFFEKCKQSVENEELKIRMSHLEKIIKLKSKNECNLTKSIGIVLPLLNEYHSVLRGHRYLTNEQVSKYEEAIRSLDGAKGISWCDVEEEEDDDTTDILQLRLNSIDENEADLLNRTRTLTTTIFLPPSSMTTTYPLKQNNRLGNTIVRTVSKPPPSASKWIATKPRTPLPFNLRSPGPSNKENIRRNGPLSLITKVKPAVHSVGRPHPYRRTPIKALVTTPKMARMKSPAVK